MSSSQPAACVLICVLVRDSISCHSDTRTSPVLTSAAAAGQLTDFECATTPASTQISRCHFSPPVHPHWEKSTESFWAQWEGISDSGPRDDQCFNQSSLWEPLDEPQDGGFERGLTKMEHQDHLIQFDGRIQRGRDSAEHLADAQYSNDSRSIFGTQTMNLHNVDYDMRD